MTDENLNEENINCEKKECCGKCKPEIENQDNKAEEYLNNWKRERADFINYKKDELERTLSLIKHSTEKFVVKLLPILDNLYLAQKHLSDDGLSQVIKQFEDFLAKEGIEEIKSVGEKFDPSFHEVVGEASPSEALAKESKSGEIVEEIQKGYKIGEKILRPAKVIITK